MKNTWIVSSVDRTIVLELLWSTDELRFTLENGEGRLGQTLSIRRSEVNNFGVSSVDAVIFSHLVRILRDAGLSAEDTGVLYRDTCYILLRWLEGKRL